jgi:hypothetical protein
VETITNGSATYGIVTMKYKMINWLSERFILPDLKTPSDNIEQQQHSNR